MSAPRVALLSNGYGEDAIGALLVRELQKQLPEARLAAFPTVDRGLAYEGLGIPILGPRQVMPSGGLLLHSLPLFWHDLRAGFLPMTWRQVQALRRLRTDLLIVVGDLYALGLSAFVQTKERYYVQPLVSVYHRSTPRVRTLNRLVMENFTGLELALIRRTVKHLYVRDLPTAEHLQSNGIEQVSALGNPMVDAVASPRANLAPLSLTAPVVALLPGTRQYAAQSLALMLQALAGWPEAAGLVAWARDDLPQVEGWQAGAPDVCDGLVRVYTHGPQRVYLLRGRFAEILAHAHLALGTAGTANEQAASQGLPVVTFPVTPLYSEAFLRNQKRLLADALTVVANKPEAIVTALKELWRDREGYEKAARAGRERMGGPGGSAAIVADILRRSSRRD